MRVANGIREGVNSCRKTRTVPFAQIIDELAGECDVIVAGGPGTLGFAKLTSAPGYVQGWGERG